MSVYQLVHHCDEGGLQDVVLHIFHGALAFVVDMRIAAPSSILIPCAGMYPSLKGAAAFTTDDLAGEAVPILVFAAALVDAFLSGKGHICLFLRD